MFRYCEAAKFTTRAVGRLVIATVTIMLIVAGGAQAQDDNLLDLEPFDVIVLNQQNQGRVLKVLPLGELPENPSRSDTLRIRLIENPSEQLEVSWSGIERIVQFQDRLLAEARQLTAQGKFDQAFEYLTAVRDRYPDADGLDTAVDELLVAEAASYYRRGHQQRALMLLGEAYRRDPTRRGLVAAIRRVLESRWRSLLDQDDYRQARRFYDASEKTYGRALPDLFRGWAGELESVAEQKLAAARQHLEAGRLRAAFLGSRDVLQIWPDAPEADQFARTAALRYPLLRVAVLHGPAKAGDAYQLPGLSVGWVHRRQQRLLSRSLFELSGVGPDGAMYDCLPGNAEVAADYRSLEITAAAGQPLSAIHLAQLMLASAQGQGMRTDVVWQSLLNRVGTRERNIAWAEFRHPFLRPESLLTLPFEGLPTDDQRQDWRPYTIVEQNASVTRFRVNQQYVREMSTQPREVIEQSYESPQEAIKALRSGQVDMVDRVFPADVRTLRDNEAFRVIRYRIPTLHALVPNFQRPHAGNRIFRRAMLYAIDRETILARDLLAGDSIQGCRVISGPLSPGLIGNDPMAYGYDESLEPRAYDPLHAKTLIQLAQIELVTAANKRKEDPPSLSGIVLACPANEIARLACNEIVEDLAVIGLPCRIRTLPAGQTRPEDDDWDFLYLDYATADPLLAAQRLLSANGFGRCPSPHLNLALRQLKVSSGWAEAGDKLRVVHQLCYDDSSVLPLWQLAEHLVIRQGISGLSTEPVMTYQDIESWRIAPE